MKDAVTIPPNTLILVWWDGQAIATVNGNTEGVIKAIEKACTDHSGFENVTLVRPVDINIGKRDVDALDCIITDNGEEYQGYIEVTSVSNYNMIIT